MTTIPPAAEAYENAVKTLDRERIVAALEQCHGNQTRAAELLGISRRTLIGRLNEYDIGRPRKR
jgi:DNA-binding protein Fis